MTYDPDRTNVLPKVSPQFPITEELPAVGPARRESGARFLFKLVVVLLIVGMAAITAVLLIIGSRQSDQAVSSDQDVVGAATVEATEGPTGVVSLPSGESGYWQVAGVADGLNVRSGPGTTNDIVGAVRLGDRHIFSTGEGATVNGSEWRQILFGDDDSVGWVSARFLVPDTAPGDTVSTGEATAGANTSVVCFRRQDVPTRAARIEFINRTIIAGVLVAESESAGSFTTQTVAGTLSSGLGLVELIDSDTGDVTQQTWIFNPTSIELGDGSSMAVASCETVAAQLP